MKYSFEIEREGQVCSFNNIAGFFYSSEEDKAEVGAIFSGLPVEVLVQVPRALRVLADKVEVIAQGAEGIPFFSMN